MARLADFVIDQSPLRIVFGDNSRAKLADEIAALGAERVLVVTTPRGAKGLDQLTLGDNVVGVFDESKQHVPEATAAAATKVAQQLNCDALIAFGGGSPVGVAKAVALEHDAVIIAVPTT